MFVEFLIDQWLYVALLLTFIWLFIRHEGIQAGPKLTTTELTLAVNKESAVIIDIRDRADYEAGHIVDAINIPFSKIPESNQILSKHKDKMLILVDKMGQHSGAIGRELRRKEYRVSRLAGGMAEWQAQHLPTVRD